MRFSLILKDESGAVLWDSSADYRLDFNATGIKEVVQNVAVLFLTSKFSQVLDRELGLDMLFVDKPIPIAQNMLVAEIGPAVQEFEDRAEIRDVEFLPSQAQAGHMAAVFTLAFNL